MSHPDKITLDRRIVRAVFEVALRADLKKASLAELAALTEVKFQIDTKEKKGANRSTTPL